MYKCTQLNTHIVMKNWRLSKLVTSGVNHCEKCYVTLPFCLNFQHVCEDLLSVWYILLIPTLFILEFRPWPTVVWSSFHLVHAESIHVFQRAQIGHGRIYYQYHLIVLRFCAYTSTCPLLYVMTMYIFFLLWSWGVYHYIVVSFLTDLFFFTHIQIALCVHFCLLVWLSSLIGLLVPYNKSHGCWNPRQQPPGLLGSQSFLDIQLFPNSIFSLFVNTNKEPISQVRLPP